jgi:TRAP transporter TAXI family solute receptor
MSAAGRRALLGCLLAAPAVLRAASAQQQQPPRPGAAAQAAPAGAPPTTGNTVSRANASAVGVIAGGLDGTYTRIAADLAAVLDDGENLRILPILGKGSMQNLADLLYLRNVDVAIVQSDVLAAAQAQRLFPGLERQVQYVAKLYEEEVHVYAKAGITEIADLAGQPVAMDNRGSGTAMTMGLLFQRLGIAVQPVHEPTVDAAEKLRRGEIAALCRVTGKPARFTGPLPEGARLLSIPLTDALLETYSPAEFTAADYPSLVPPGDPVETLAVGAVLAVYNHRTAERRDRVVRFQQALAAKFDQFLRPPRHPKWREVNLSAQIPGWTRFGAAAGAPPSPPRPGAGGPRPRRPTDPRLVEPIAPTQG